MAAKKAVREGLGTRLGNFRHRLKNFKTPVMCTSITEHTEHHMQYHGHYSVGTGFAAHCPYSTEKQTDGVLLLSGSKLNPRRLAGSRRVERRA